MEHKSTHSRILSESDKQVTQYLVTTQINTRQKLLEKGLQKDNFSVKSRNCSNPHPSERFSFPSSTHNPTPSSNPSLQQNSFQKPIHKRAQSMDKKPNQQKKHEKPTDCIVKVAEKLSVKKINVKFIQELFRISTAGDTFVCRALLALVSEVDYHIGESPNFPIQLFFEYISTPGIVIQTLKRIPEFISNERIPSRKQYLECFTKALELFNQATEISPLPGIEILAELLQVVFTVKGLRFKPLDLGCYGEKVVQVKHRAVQSVEIEKKVKKSEVKVTQTTDQELKLSPKKTPIKSLQLNIMPVQNLSEEFMESKTCLLGKFYSKMGMTQTKIVEREKSPVKEYLNYSLEFKQNVSETNFYIKPKLKGRAGSVTPRSESTSKSSSRSRIFMENNKSVNREKIEDLKKTQFLLGSRFYKKIDQKFVETLVGKFKNESLEVKKLRAVNFEEYMKRKNVFISANKNKWVIETLRYLETSDLLVPANENDLGQDKRHDALLEHLNNDQHVSSLVRKAEQQELASRRITLH